MKAVMCGHAECVVIEECLYLPYLFFLSCEAYYQQQ
ncbi:hypothetical protein, unlikely [Trypanosoma brucei brucei TREU927]|uniref:Uncharacterized protein n=1 Tax=Trypanosoma brucei brucei (strain 927/4 GUTat10.1) TaxID=185431 RepID=Q38FM1_TRYB2|nr:hypothetical protein, unlikely [Trypanosoma brucei brucei TREU927]EAN76399.1 hypothetical protein, unlikely [Trypanosoma brucei brucei TREU927]